MRYERATNEAYKAKKLEGNLSKKTVNNHRTVLRRMLVLARRFKGYK